MEWNKTYGETTSRAESVIQTIDGGFALAGYTNSYNGTRDFYLVKTNSTGDLEWSQTYDGGETSPEPQPTFPGYILGAVIAAIAVVSVGGLALYRKKQKKPKDRDYYSEGTSHYNSQRYYEATDSFGKALEVNPKNFEALLGQAGSLSNLQRYQEAVDSFNKAIEINPKSFEAWLGKGGCLCSLQRYEEALTSYDKAIEINPEKGDVFYNKGACLFNIGRFEEAIANFDKALKINPQDSAAKEAAASARKKLG
jgi:tetratricopeptide (TPR) repeat protein